MTIRSIFAALCASSLAFGLGAVSANADPADGEKLARRWCAACHLVAPDQPTAATDAPPLAAVARMPGFNRDKLAYFLLHPHPKMPDMGLARSEASDLADYIATLRAQP
jgi:mono/diheme cytochrome c family protein